MADGAATPRSRAGARSLRSLGLFWLVLLVLGSAGVAVLDRLGPPERDAPGHDREAAEAAGPEAQPDPAPVVAVAPVTQAQPRAPLIADPDPALLDRLRDGTLPRISEDGRSAFRTYARPFDAADRRPRVAVLVAGLGISESGTEEAIARLPGAVSLAFSPYGIRLAEFAAQARADGHEVLVSIPMEPVGFPLNDPGPQALLTSLSWGENNQRLMWVLSRFPGYVGATNVLGPTLRGERFSASPESMRPMLEVLRARGLMFIEARPGEPAPQTLPARSVDLVLDERPARAEIEQRLAELERLARERGAALGLAGPGALARDLIATWAQGLEAKGLALAPVSAIAAIPGRQAQR
jgi:polysaccharide deacetylase 2 family uncharacterized protein YibQ